ncbi:MAG: hypothetical protein Q9217_004207 [Psora testacea]
MVHSSQTISFADRTESPSISPLNRYLLSLISIKHTNLCVSADVHTTHELFEVAEEVGDYICVLKTHADIINDFSERTIRGLQDVAMRKRFLIFEDRKFGDISNATDTVQSQYTGGPLSIASWAHLTNAHLLPGPSLVPALQSAAFDTLASLNQSVATTISTGTPRRSLDSNPDPTPNNEAPPTSSKAAKTDVVFQHHRSNRKTACATTTISQTYEAASPPQPPALLKPLSFASDEDFTPQSTASALATLGPPPHARGLLLLAQMSSAGNLVTPEYTSACISTARANKDFVMGFVCQKNLNREKDDNFLSFTPGVSLPKGDESANGIKGDGKGQVWRTPEDVISKDGIDVVIVGRGILAANDRGREAERYRKAAWAAYEGRLHKG